MQIRRAVEKDIPKVMELLSQVLEVHASARPDVFISGTTKYQPEELKQMFLDDQTPVYVGVDQDDQVLGYAFCVLKKQPDSENMIQFDSIYIDDLCVDASARGQHVGQHLFEFVKQTAKDMGCYEVTLNVWEGNDSARRFYDAMGLKPMKTTMEFVL